RHSQDEILALLHLDPTLEVTLTGDEFGYTWITARQATVDLPALVTALHAVNTTLTDTGFGPSLLCTVVGFTAPPGDTPTAAPPRLALVYLFKRGTVYPFAPLGDRRRDTSLELQVRAVLGGDLPIESDLQRWFPVWDAPVP
ncbi:PspA-associated protein PspAB, partial [Rhodococcus sp. SJ]